MMSGKFLLVWIGVFALSGVNAYSANTPKEERLSGPYKEVTLTLYKDVSIDHTMITLGDIAQIVTADLVLRNRLQAIQIAKAPRVGYFRNVNKTRVLALMDKELPDIYKRVKWAGANSVKVGVIGQVIERDRYVALAKRELESVIKSISTDYKLTERGVYKDLNIPKGNVLISTSIGNGKRGNTDRLTSSMKIWVDVIVDKTHYQSVPVWFDVKTYKNTFVFTKDLPQGYVVSEKDFDTRYTNIANPQGVRQLDDIPEDMRLKQNVKAGAVLTENLLQEVPDVTQGNTVKVVVEVGVVKLNASAIALEDGFIGDKITVRKPQSDISYKVTIVGKNTVAADGEG